MNFEHFCPGLFHEVLLLSDSVKAQFKSNVWFSLVNIHNISIYHNFYHFQVISVTIVGFSFINRGVATFLSKCKTDKWMSSLPQKCLDTGTWTVVVHVLVRLFVVALAALMSNHNQNKLGVPINMLHPSSPNPEPEVGRASVRVHVCVCVWYHEHICGPSSSRNPPQVR